MDWRSAAMQNALRRALFMLCLCFMGLFLGCLYSYIEYEKRTTADARSTVVTVSRQAAGQIDAILTGIAQVANDLSVDLSSGTIDKDNLVSRLKTETVKNSNIFGFVVAYRPYAFAPDRKLYAPYYHQEDGAMVLTQVEDVYDYTAPAKHTMYYCAPMTQNSAQWIEPFWGEASRRLVVTYSAPFYANNDKTAPIGVVAAVVSLDNIRRIVESLDLGASGYGGIVSRAGTYLYHPRSQYVSEQKTIFDVAKETDDKDRQLVGERSRRGESGIVNHVSKTTGMESWLIYEPIKTTGWSLNSTFIRDDIHLDVDHLRRQVIVIIVFGVLAALFFASWLSGAASGRNLGLVAGLASFTFLVGIGIIWSVTFQFAPNRVYTGLRIVDRPTLAKYMNSCTVKTMERAGTRPTYIPTGIMVIAGEFLREDKIELSGYVWQKYTVGEHDGVGRGIDFLNATSIKLDEVYRATVKNEEIIGWKFNAVLAEQFNYSRYPLEQESILINLRHKDFFKHVRLVPDLDSYQVINPSSLPGVARTMQMPGWLTRNSGFEYRVNALNINFGLPRVFNESNADELSFKIVVRRVILNVFISKLIPITVVAFLLFVFMLSATPNKEQSSSVDIGTGRILSAIAALFIVIIYSHIDLRTQVSAGGVCYLEYIYFTIYFALSAVALNSLLYSRFENLVIVQYRDNFIPKLLYWPLITGLIFVITVLSFY